jgi:hypothetical protein
MATYKKWTQTDLEFIQNNQQLYSDDELAVKLSQICGQNITTAMVRRQRRKLHIEKPKGRRPKNRAASVVNASAQPTSN